MNVYNDIHHNKLVILVSYYTLLVLNHIINVGLWLADVASSGVVHPQWRSELNV